MLLIIHYPLKGFTHNFLFGAILYSLSFISGTPSIYYLPQVLKVALTKHWSLQHFCCMVDQFSLLKKS
ncbi:hypothetical protein P3L10_017834 [Capsicum annuum]